jgi:ASC-1-like (ASCH) protein
MTSHEMRLHPRPFALVREGTKVIESRLNDEKRQQIKIGDHVIFTLRPDFIEKIEVEVADLIHAPTFRDLFLSHSLPEFGVEDGDIEGVKNMYQYYSKEDEVKYGVVGIKFKKL